MTISQYTHAVKIQNMVSIGPQLPWDDQPRLTIQEALAVARAGKAPSIDIDRCIKICPPSKFLRILWSELVNAAATLEMENCKRIATFILTMPRSVDSNSPPLLPLFLHMLPALINVIDTQQPPEQTMNVELIATVVSSVLCAALHLELAFPEKRLLVLGQTSQSMARTLAAHLRHRGASSRIITQRLSSSSAFVTNFPVFLSELGT